MKTTGQDFLELTKYPYLSESDQEQDLPCPELEMPEPSSQLITLPSPESLKVTEISLQTAINSRRSLRKFSPSPLTLDELTWLLWATQGVQEELAHATIRTVPSAGSRHPFETYLAITNVTGLKPGLYRYLALSHKLAFIREEGEIGKTLAAACLNQKWMSKAAVTFVWVAVPYRTTWRYSERGWRYILLDAGHICQNLYLACGAIAAGCCAVDAFDDDALNRLLGLDGKESLTLYAASVGRI
mgnify:CR=1 FL=1